MKNYDELYFTIQSDNTYSIKGLITYQHHHPEKDGDITCEYKKINFTNDKQIQIIEGKQIANNLVIYSPTSCSYSSHAEEKILTTMTFEELICSEYWESINNKYKFDVKKYENYKNNNVYEDDEEIAMDCVPLVGSTISIRFNKFNNEIDIYSCSNSFCGNLWDLHLLSEDEFNELQQYKTIVELMKNHKVLMLDNGYVVDNVYYENIDDFKETKDGDK